MDVDVAQDWPDRARTPPAAGEDGPILDHLSRLARNLERFPCSGSPEVLAEVEISGHRYVLTRTSVSQAPHLSAREREIARLVAEGLPNKAIGRVLDISQWTVASYLRRIFEKLSVTTRAEMVCVAIQNDLLDTLAPPLDAGRRGV